MRRLLLTLAIALVVAGPATAKKGDAPPPPEPAAEPELTAAPGSIAYGMIEQADADGVFELVHDGQVTIRHVGSGLICHFLRNGDGGRLLLFPGLPRGDDVACDSNDGREFITLYATRYPGGATVEAQIDGAEAAIRQRFPDALRITPLDETAADRLPQRRHAQFLVHNSGGDRLYTRASVAQVGDWIIKMRYSTAAPDAAAALQAERASSGIFEGALEEILPPPNL